MHLMNGAPVWCPRPRSRGDGPQAREISNEYGLDYAAIRALVARAKARGLITMRDTPDEEPAPTVFRIQKAVMYHNACDLCGKTYTEQKRKIHFVCHFCQHTTRPCKECGNAFSSSTGVTCSKECRKSLMRKSRIAQIDQTRVRIHTPPDKCRGCGQPFAPIRTGIGFRKTCSLKCMQIARKTKKCTTK